MKPSDGIDTYNAINHCHYNCWKRSKGHTEDKDVPIRMRGYGEVAMGNLTPKERKEIDSALRRGYSLSINNRTRVVIDFITRSVDFAIGYLGKSKGSLWFPDADMRDRCLKLMEAQLVMTRKFTAAGLRARGPRGIYIQVPTGRGQSTCKAYLTELRLIVDEFMAEWAAEREQFANRLLSDDAVVRVPFDSHKEKDND